MKTLLTATSLADHILSRLDDREAALWFADGTLDGEHLPFVGLPWKVVMCERVSDAALSRLKNLPDTSDAMVRKRGYIYPITSDPSRLELPERCLPLFIMGGEGKDAEAVGFEARLKRMTMLDALRRSGVKELVVVCGAQKLPTELRELWESGFRSFLTIVGSSENTEQEAREWTERTQEVLTLVQSTTERATAELLRKYTDRYTQVRDLVRLRDARGHLHQVDVTGADDPDRPLLEKYDLLRVGDLASLMPTDISETEFQQFFQDPNVSWRPYAAGLPWELKMGEIKKRIGSLLTRLDVTGSEENCVAFISAESGSGGTTCSRVVAMACARLGYPVLIAKPLPFTPDPQSVVNYLNSANSRVQREPSGASTERHYETPWLLVFDYLHWQNREAELDRFRQELTRSGRVVCTLVVIGSVKPMAFYNRSIFKEIGVLTHMMSEDDAVSLGSHLSKFRTGLKKRAASDWRNFYRAHTVRYADGIAAFWVSLSFWLQGQYNLDESIQSWVYRHFKEQGDTALVRKALLEIGALATERVPLPEGLLPRESGTWPVQLLLEDRRADLSALGLVKISADGDKYWALVHDLLGRWLINALFHDVATRTEMGFESARDAEHLRFLILRQISAKPELGERGFRSLAEEFATTFFKIDPDHGLGSFTTLWREVLAALEAMPRTVLDNSRVFRHHMAVSRRRISRLDGSLYQVSTEDRRQLLSDAVRDIQYALQSIQRRPGDEPDLLLFNSLANAYFDMADVEQELGASRERILELRGLAAEATRLAYSENPNNPFTVETYVKNLIQDAKASPEVAVERCVEALSVVFSALSSHEVVYRKAHLGALGDSALGLLLKQIPDPTFTSMAKTPIELLVQVWSMLAHASSGGVFSGFDNLESETRRTALNLLLSEVGAGNLQVLRLRYDLSSTEYPYAYTQQIVLLDELEGSNYRMTPQLKLEYAVVLFQVGRNREGDDRFRELRKLWRNTEQFVYVPDRLRWLREEGVATRRIVNAVVGSEHSGRPMARIPALGNILAPFRAEEHGLVDARPGRQFACTVSFGHNGPFLRPPTSLE